MSSRGEIKENLDNGSERNNDNNRKSTQHYGQHTSHVQYSQHSNSGKFGEMFGNAKQFSNDFIGRNRNRNKNNENNNSNNNNKSKNQDKQSHYHNATLQQKSIYNTNETRNDNNGRFWSHRRQKVCFFAKHKRIKHSCKDIGLLFA